MGAQPVYTGLFGHTAVRGYDVVAYFTDGKPLKGDKQFSFEWQGAEWRFASAEHRAAFQAEPEKYAPQYGGYCAYAIAAKDELVSTDPDAWAIVDGKLYLNYSREVQGWWEEKREEFIKQGDRNWPSHLE